MNKKCRRGLALGALASLGLAACSSSTTIYSRPSGARLYLNGEPAGVTPYTMTDTKIVGSTTAVRLELPGYEVTTGSITRNEVFDAGACLGGVLILFPFLWIQGYNPIHVFELRPVGWNGQPYPPGYAPPPGYEPGPGAPAPGYQPPPGAPPQPPVAPPPAAAPPNGAPPPAAKPPAAPNP
jgi:hypothetical protein